MLFSPELGLDGSSDEFDRPLSINMVQQIVSGGRDEKDEVFVNSLRRLTALPVEGIRVKEHVRIDHLVLSGDSTGDERFLELLKEVLGDRYEELIFGASNGFSSDVDPLYAAAGYAAFCSLNGMII